MQKKLKKKVDLSLIILSYNSQFWLKKLLSSLKKEYLNKTKYNIEVIVVDNNSSDDSVDVIKKEFPWVNLIELNDNIGFSGGNNHALKKINSKYTMLINNDVEFTQNSNLDILIDYMNQNKDTAVITPKVTLNTGELDWACHRGEPTLWASASYFLKLDRIFPKKPKFSQYHLLYKDLTTIHQIDACTGAAMMIRVSKMKKVGLLDERFFMYGEDLDWCKRFRELGDKIIYNPQVEIIHHKYKSGIKSTSDRTATKIKIQFYNAMMLYFDKHYKNTTPRIYRWLLRLVLFIKKGGL